MWEEPFKVSFFIKSVFLHSWDFINPQTFRIWQQKTRTNRSHTRWYQDTKRTDNAHFKGRHFLMLVEIWVNPYLILKSQKIIHSKVRRCKRKVFAALIPYCKRTLYLFTELPFSYLFFQTKFLQNYCICIFKANVSFGNNCLFLKCYWGHLDRDFKTKITF